MIVLLICLWSVCAVCITRFLSKKGMRAASVAFTVLYAYVIAWTFFITVIDIVQLGFSESRFSALYGSYNFKSFLSLSEWLCRLSDELLFALVVVCFAAASVLLAVLTIGGIGIYHAFLSLRGSKPRGDRRKGRALLAFRLTDYIPRLYIRHCRLNC